MRLTIEQILADNAKMEQYICERIPPATTRIDLGRGAWADLTPFWDDRFGWSLLLETDEPEWVDLSEVYQHFRREEMTSREWWREFEGEMARSKVRSLEGEIASLRQALSKVTAAAGQDHNDGRRLITPRECQQERFQRKISLRQVYQLFYEGELEGFRVGRTVLLFHDTVDSYIERNRNKKGPSEDERVDEEERPDTISQEPKPPREEKPRHHQQSGYQFFHLPERR
jgi:hypothetical protein